MKYKKYYLKDVKEQANKKLFTVISTFAGGGGSSTGYRLAGANVLAMNEFVEEAITTYSQNYPDTTIIPGDITKLTGEDFLKATNLKVGELDILDGSPPCSAFSRAGKQSKGWNKTKLYSDGKKVENIEDLFFHFLRIANEIRPKVIVAENVAGMLDKSCSEKFNEILNDFESIGYNVTYELMDASEYGVPQARKRVLFVGIRYDVTEKIGLNELNIGHAYPRPSREKIGIEEAIGDVINDEDEVKELFDYVENSFQKKVIKHLPTRPLKHASPSDKEHRSWNPKGSYFNMIVPAPHLPSPTLTQMGQKKSISGVFHYEHKRKLTIKEMVRLMSLPEDYVLTGTFDQKAERICRMVAPKMMQALAESIYETILVPYYEQ